MKVMLGFITGAAIALLIGFTVSDRVDSVYVDIVDGSNTSTATFLFTLGTLGGFTGSVIIK